MGKIIGIDLGTTNSVVAVMEGGEPVVIPTAEGSRLFPSVVAVNPKTDERMVGQVARRQAVTNPENTIFSIKRLMGRKFTDPEVQKARKILPYKIVEHTNGDACVVMGGKDYSPPEISAMILQKMKTDAEAYLGETGDAGRDHRAGVLQRLRSARPPRTPARSPAWKCCASSTSRPPPSLAYGLDKKKDETIAVYDLGGGTFDISILDVGDGVFEVQVAPTATPSWAATTSISASSTGWPTNSSKEQGIDLRSDRMALQRLKEAAREGQDRALDRDADRDQPAVHHGRCQRPQAPADDADAAPSWSSLIGDLIERSIEPVQARAGRRQAQAVDEIDEVVLVGGMTRMPAVQEAVRKFFGQEPHKGVNPDEVVAIGAAIQAGVLGGEVKDILLLDVTPLTLGIETLGGVATPLIERNTTIPTKKSQVFSTASDMQTEVEINVMQGERPMARDNKTLGNFILTAFRPRRAACRRSK